MFSASDHQFMTRALRLAEQGLYTTTPNPRVGCVIVRDGLIVGEGAHLRAGEAHAEVLALQQAGSQAQGATIYVSLEPCSHHGRTPPCANALVKAKVARVVVAMQDPNPLVAGQGLAYLQSMGVVVDIGLMQAEAHALNAGFISRVLRNRPFVRSKIAASLDGKTALANGVSQWITGAAARADVQHWRAQSCAILTGIGTVLNDNPSLSVRAFPTSRQPVKVIVDSRLRMSAQAKMLQQGRTIIAYAQDPLQQAAALTAAGAELLPVPDTEGRVCLLRLLNNLADQGINDLMVEAGECLNGALMAKNLIDELLIYYAPKFMGSAGRNMFALPAFTSLDAARTVQVLDVRQLGDDIRLRVKPTAHAD